jgi:hypothetical protein
MITRVGYYKYDNADVIGKCHNCGGDVVDAIELSNLISLTASQREDIELGVYTIAFCPVCAQAFLTVVAVEED